MTAALDAVDKAPEAAAAPYDVERLRADFPMLGRQVHCRPLVFLVSAASPASRRRPGGTPGARRRT